MAWATLMKCFIFSRWQSFLSCLLFVSNPSATTGLCSKQKNPCWKNPSSSRLISQHNLDYSNWSEVNWFTSRAMSSMWGNFAKMGDPTPPGWSWHATCSSRTCNSLVPISIAATPPGSPAGMTWEPVDPEDQKYLEIGDQLVMTRDPWFGERMDFWDNIIVEK